MVRLVMFLAYYLGRLRIIFFGNNTSRNGCNEKISMTSRVNMQQLTRQWRMYFAMPGEYSLNSLPIPYNPAVTMQ